MKGMSSTAPAPRTEAPDGEELSSYAAIGDGRTVALIGMRGQVDWMPIPNLGSLPVFARLLDDETGGCIELEPTEDYTRRPAAI